MSHVILIPERFALGDVISFKARRASSIKCDRLTVCCPQAWRFLFPTASDFIDVDEILTAAQSEIIVNSLKKQYPDAEFICISRKYDDNPDLEVSIPNRFSEKTDILIAPRKKTFSSPHRNWEFWPFLANKLVKAGLNIKSIGKADMSYDCGIPIVEDLRDIAAHMLQTRFVVSTDSAFAHLAILLKTPLIVLWGTPIGVIPGQKYRDGCHGRMEAHKKSFLLHIEGAWNDPDLVVSEILKIFNK